MSNEELTLHQQLGIPIRSRLYQTAGIFIAGIGIMWGMASLSWIIEHIINPISINLAWLISSMLQLFGEPVQQVGTMIKGPSVDFEITATGTGIYQIIILSAGIFAWAKTSRERWRGIIFGFIILMHLNVLRIFSIYLSTLIFPDWLPFVQGVFWQGVMVLYVPVYWMCWLKAGGNAQAKLSSPQHY
jgi:exosortase/archaeosortase family protein